MKIYWFLLVLVTSGCTSQRIFIKCEAPYFSGEVRNGRIDRHGTYFKTLNGDYVDYPPSVKCEMTRSKG